MTTTSTDWPSGAGVVVRTEYATEGGEQIMRTHIRDYAPHGTLIHSPGSEHLIIVTTADRFEDGTLHDAEVQYPTGTEDAMGVEDLFHSMSVINAIYDYLAQTWKKRPA